MSKYEIGQEIPVGGIITITGLAHNKNGNPVYNTDRGVVVPELLIERLEMKPLEKAQPEQPKQEDKPTYKSGDKVKVIGNGNPIRHYARVGSIQTVMRVFSDSVQITERYQTISFADLEPYTEPESTEPKLIVTKKMLEEMGACNSGVRAFVENFPSGEGEFSEVFDKAMEIGRDSDAKWLEGQKRIIKEKQNEPKQEPVKLYCVGDYAPGNCLTKGKVYEYIPGNRFPYDNGQSGCSEKDYATWARFNPIASSHLIPLVSRPAQVGEWVYLVKEPCVNQKGDSYPYACDFHKGDIVKITHFGSMPSVRAKCDGNMSGFRENEYLVLDGYKPEPEKAEPEYYSGKVVCVEVNSGYWGTDVEQGKVYDVCDGQFIYKGKAASMQTYTGVPGVNEPFVHAKFIEFKGE